MAGRIAVYLITGFLGSGKTTFLNRFMEMLPEGRRVAVLMNEIGEIGVDGPLVMGKGGKDFDLVEISRGSIFCICVKTDFIKALYEIAWRIQPDLLIMESTGVADPTDLKRDLNLPLFKNRFHLQDQFCVLDAVNFEEAYPVFASIEKQIASSTLFIINKKDLSSPDRIDRVKNIVRRHHPAPRFVETSYGDVLPDDLLKCMKMLSAKEGKENSPPPSPQDLDNAVDQLMTFSTIGLMPPDRLVSAVYAWKGDDIGSFQDLMKKFPGKILRGKGFIKDNETTLLFNLVMGKTELKPITLPGNRTDLLNRIVFIGPAETLKRLEDLSNENPSFSKGITFDPMEGVKRSSALYS